MGSIMNLGYIAAFVYVIMTTASTLFIESRLQNIGYTFTVLFVTMIVTSLFFNVAGLKLFKQAYRNVLNDKKNYAIFCLFVSLVWVCSIYGVQKSNALMFNIFFFMTSAIFVNYKKYRQGEGKVYLFLTIIPCFILCMVLYNNISIYVGIALSALGGIASYLYRIVSFKYAKKYNASALEIMMTRFIPIIIIMSAQVKVSVVANVISHYYLEILMFAFISFIIPTYCSQYANNEIGVENTAIIASLIFPLCWLGDYILNYGHHVVDLLDLVAAVVTTLIAVMPFIINRLSLK